MGRNNEQIVGDYKIETSAIFGGGSVRKALGPWPLRNWSWITFYNGTAEDCQEFARWAARVDAGDRLLLDHAWAWLRGRLQKSPAKCPEDWADDALHLPKCWGYDFKQALALPAPAKEQTSDFSGELFAIFVAVITLLIFGFFYHST